MKQRLLQFMSLALLTSFIGCGSETPPPTAAKSSPLAEDSAPKTTGATKTKKVVKKAPGYTGPNAGEPTGAQ